MLNQNDIAMKNQEIITVDVAIHLCVSKEEIIVRFEVDNNDETLNRFSLAREAYEQIDTKDTTMGVYYRKVMATFSSYGFERKRNLVTYPKDPLQSGKERLQLINRGGIICLSCIFKKNRNNLL